MYQILSSVFAVLVALSSVTAIAAEYRLPFEGRWFVAAGGDTINVNHHMVERSQWFAVDFLKTGGPSDRAVTTGKGDKVEDFYSWGQKVLSPADGVIHTVHDGDIDNPIGKADKTNAFGNYVVVEAGPAEFVYLAHFQKGSITVKPGQKVKAGELLGKCGNSGNTSGPHIHMHVQDRAAPYTGAGQMIPFRRINVLLSGKEFDDVNWPLLQGLFVWPADEK